MRARIARALVLAEIKDEACHTSSERATTTSAGDSKLYLGPV